MDVHDRIRNLREKENISREVFAKALGVTYAAMSKYETGKRQPDYDTLQKIADYFDVTTDYLLGRTDNPKLINYKNKEVESADSFTYNGQEVHLDELTPDQRVLIEWAISRESLSFKDKPQDLFDLLDRIRNIKPYIDEIENKEKNSPS